MSQLGIGESAKGKKQRMQWVGGVYQRKSHVGGECGGYFVHHVQEWKGACSLEELMAACEQ